MTHFYASRSLNRTVSLSVLICFLTSSALTPAVASAQPADSDAGSAPHRQFSGDVTKIQIPEELGKVEDAFNGTGKKRVVLIQDAHSIPEAQRSIQKVIDHFQTEYGFELVALEGASGPLDPQVFKSFPEPEILQKTFQEYFDQGELTGGNAAALFNESKALYHGIEDWALYEAGLGLYLEAIGHEPEILETLKVWKENLAGRKAQVYSKELLEIDRLLGDFYEDHTDLAQALTRLASIQEPAPGTELSLLLGEIRKNPREEAALQLEVKNLAGHIKSFLKSRETTEEGKAKLKSFHEKYQEYQTSRLSPEAFVLFLKELIAEFHLSFKISEGLGRLVVNQKRIQEIEGTRLYRELQVYVEAVKGSLMKTPEERALNQESDQYQLLSRLARLELTFEDWDRLSRHSDEKNLLRFFSPHLAFYQNSEKRDQAFFKHLTQLMKETQSEQALLVAGGFHTEGLTRQFQEAGISYLLIRPAIPSVPKESVYRAQMQGEVSWKNYFKVEKGRVNLYQAFVRAARDALMRSYESQVKGYGSPRNSPLVTRNSLFLLKAWRDQIIRDLARQGRVKDAGQYTPLIDEAAGLAGASLPIQDERLSEWLANADRFVRGLGDLQSQGQLTQQNVLKLLQPSAIPAGASSAVFSRFDSSHPELLGLPASTARAEARGPSNLSPSPSTPLPSFSLRSEARSDPTVVPSHFLAFYQRRPLQNIHLDDLQAIERVVDAMRDAVARELKFEAASSKLPLTYYPFSSIGANRNHDPKNTGQFLQSQIFDNVRLYLSRILSVPIGLGDIQFSVMRGDMILRGFHGGVVVIPGVSFVIEYEPIPDLWQRLYVEEQGDVARDKPLGEIGLTLEQISDHLATSAGFTTGPFDPINSSRVIVRLRNWSRKFYTIYHEPNMITVTKFAEPGRPSSSVKIDSKSPEFGVLEVELLKLAFPRSEARAGTGTTEEGPERVERWELEVPVNDKAEKSVAEDAVMDVLAETGQKLKDSKADYVVLRFIPPTVAAEKALRSFGFEPLVSGIDIVAAMNKISLSGDDISFSEGAIVLNFKDGLPDWETVKKIRLRPDSGQVYRDFSQGFTQGFKLLQAQEKLQNSALETFLGRLKTYINNDRLKVYGIPFGLKDKQAKQGFVDGTGLKEVSDKLVSEDAYRELKRKFEEDRKAREREDVILKIQGAITPELEQAKKDLLAFVARRLVKVKELTEGDKQELTKISAGIKALDAGLLAQQSYRTGDGLEKLVALARERLSDEVGGILGRISGIVGKQVSLGVSEKARVELGWANEDGKRMFEIFLELSEKEGRQVDPETFKEALSKEGFLHLDIEEALGALYKAPDQGDIQIDRELSETVGRALKKKLLSEREKIRTPAQAVLIRRAYPGETHEPTVQLIGSRLIFTLIDHSPQSEADQIDSLIPKIPAEILHSFTNGKTIIGIDSIVLRRNLDSLGDPIANSLKNKPDEESLDEDWTEKLAPVLSGLPWGVGLFARRIQIDLPKEKTAGDGRDLFFLLHRDVFLRAAIYWDVGSNGSSDVLEIFRHEVEQYLDRPLRTFFFLPGGRMKSFANLQGAFVMLGTYLEILTAARRSAPVSLGEEKSTFLALGQQSAHQIAGGTPLESLIRTLVEVAVGKLNSMGRLDFQTLLLRGAKIEEKAHAKDFIFEHEMKGGKASMIRVPAVANSAVRLESPTVFHFFDAFPRSLQPKVQPGDIPEQILLNLGQLMTELGAVVARVEDSEYRIREFLILIAGAARDQKEGNEITISHATSFSFLTGFLEILTRLYGQPEAIKNRLRNEFDEFLGATLRLIRLLNFYNDEERKRIISTKGDKEKTAKTILDLVRPGATIYPNQIKFKEQIHGMPDGQISKLISQDPRFTSADDSFQKRASESGNTSEEVASGADVTSKRSEARSTALFNETVRIQLWKEVEVELRVIIWELPSSTGQGGRATVYEKFEDEENPESLRMRSLNIDLAENKIELSFPALIHEKSETWSKEVYSFTDLKKNTPPNDDADTLYSRFERFLSETARALQAATHVKESIPGEIGTFLENLAMRFESMAEQGRGVLKRRQEARAAKVAARKIASEAVIEDAKGPLEDIDFSTDAGAERIFFGIAEDQDFRKMGPDFGSLKSDPDFEKVGISVEVIPPDQPDRPQGILEISPSFFSGELLGVHELKETIQLVRQLIEEGLQKRNLNNHDLRSWRVLIRKITFSDNGLLFKIQLSRSEARATPPRPSLLNEGWELSLEKASESFDTVTGQEIIGRIREHVQTMLEGGQNTGKGEEPILDIINSLLSVIQNKRSVGKIAKDLLDILKGIATSQKSSKPVAGSAKAALVHIMMEGSSRYKREAAAKILKNLDWKPETAEEKIRILLVFADSSLDLRIDEWMQNHSPEFLLPIFLSVLKLEDSDMPQTALTGLLGAVVKMKGLKESGPILIDFMMRSDTESELVAALEVMSGFEGNVDAAQTIATKYMGDWKYKSVGLKISAVRTLGLLRVPLGLKIIQEALDPKEPTELRLEALYSLTQFSGVTQILLKLALEDPDPSIRYSAQSEVIRLLGRGRLDPPTEKSLEEISSVFLAHPETFKLGLVTLMVSAHFEAVSRAPRPPPVLSVQTSPPSLSEIAKEALDLATELLKEVVTEESPNGIVTLITELIRRAQPARPAIPINPPELATESKILDMDSFLKFADTRHTKERADRIAFIKDQALPSVLKEALDSDNLTHEVSSRELAEFLIRLKPDIFLFSLISGIRMLNSGLLSSDYLTKVAGLIDLISQGRRSEARGGERRYIEDKNSLGVMIGMPRNELRISRSLSPVMMASTFPATAHSRMRLSLGSLQPWIVSLVLTILAVSWRRETRSEMRFSGMSALSLGRENTETISWRIAGESTRRTSPREAFARIFLGIPRLVMSALTRTLVSVTISFIDLLTGRFDHFLDLGFRQRRAPPSSIDVAQKGPPAGWKGLLFKLSHKLNLFPFRELINQLLDLASIDFKSWHPTYLLLNWHPTVSALSGQGLTGVLPAPFRSEARSASPKGLRRTEDPAKLQQSRSEARERVTRNSKLSEGVKEEVVAILAPEGVRSELRKVGIEPARAEVAAEEILRLVRQEKGDLRQVALQFREALLNAYDRMVSQGLLQGETTLNPEKFQAVLKKVIDTLLQTKPQNVSLGLDVRPGTDEFQVRGPLQMLVKILQKELGGERLELVYDLGELEDQRALKPVIERARKELNAFPRPHDLTRPIEPRNPQSQVAVIVIGGKVGVSIDGMFLPVQVDLEGETDVLVTDFSEILKIVVALHLTDLLAGEKTKKPGEVLKAKLLERFVDLSPAFDQVIQFDGQSFTVRASVARRLLLEAETLQAVRHSA